MIKYFTLFLAVIFNWFTLSLICLVLAVQIAVTYYGKDLPSSYEITNYRPMIVTKVFDNDGNIIDNFYNEKRIFLSIEEIPDMVINAFISAEDKNFFSHKGYDPVGLLKAFYDALNGKRMRGASTITQQVMKNFLLSNERSVTRKIKEIILALRLEKNMPKNKILEVYLNEIYLGQGIYGVAAASYKYFGKTLNELSISETAFLAALPKAPNRYHPVKNNKEAIARRNFVLKEMYENGFIDKETLESQKNHSLSNFIDNKNKNNFFQSLDTKRSYFSSEIRRQMLQIFEKSDFYNEGYVIKTSFNQKFQDIAKNVLQYELIKYEKENGVFHGFIDKISLNEWEQKISEIDTPKINNWEKAVLLSKNDLEFKIGILGKPQKSNLDLKSLLWIKSYIKENKKVISKNIGDFLSIGDIFYVEKSKNKKDEWELRQIPKVEGSFIVMEAYSGRVLAMQGGFSFEKSVFNRATQAKRQPGSLFKPFVYAAALENGYHPTSIIVDAPIDFETYQGLWSPKNATDNWFGVAPLRKGLEFSRNLMTIRLANEIGIDEVAKYANIFNIYENMPKLLSYSIGAGETTLINMVSAYSSFANGGFEVKPSFVDRVQNRNGETIFSNDFLKCENCISENKKIKLPLLKEKNQRILDPVTVYRINSMLQGVVKRGTASNTVGKLKYSIAGKTGTTNKAKDAWFIGYTPELVVGCYIGFDTPKPLGNNASGGKLCGAPVSSFFEKIIKKDINWEKPSNTISIFVNKDTGVRVDKNFKADDVISELFRKGEEPNVGEAANFIDGGFSMGQDLIINENNKTYFKNDQYKRPTTGGLITGDLY